MSRWYRAYEGTVTDPKLGEAALVAGCSKCVAIAAWHAILESAASAQDAGRFDTTPRRVAVTLGEPPATIEAIFSAFAELGMARDGVVTAWQKRQFESDSSTERARKHRERRKNNDDTSRNSDATLQERSATPPYTETDTERSTEPSVPSAQTLKPARRASRLPTDWQPSADDTQFCETMGMSSEAIGLELAKYRDYWAAKAGAGGVKLDWSATWRNWIRKAISDGATHDNRNRQAGLFAPNRGGPREDPLITAARREIDGMHSAWRS